MLTVVLGIQEIPSDHWGRTELPRDEIRVEATSFEDGVAEAKRQIPDGWRHIWIRVDRP